MAYSDRERAEALIRLAVNKYDWNKTAEETGISAKTLRRWDKTVPKKGVYDLLQRAVEQLLINVPSDLKGDDWAVAVGILLDKWLLAGGKPTQRTETIERQMMQMPDDEYFDIVAEAERILEAQAGRRAGSGRG